MCFDTHACSSFRYVVMNSGKSLFVTISMKICKQIEHVSQCNTAKSQLQNINGDYICVLYVSAGNGSNSYSSY